MIVLTAAHTDCIRDIVRSRCVQTISRAFSSYLTTTSPVEIAVRAVDSHFGLDAADCVPLRFCSIILNLEVRAAI